MISITMFGFPL
jgi:hypothetical protein